MDGKKTLIIAIILICALSLAYGIYYQIAQNASKQLQENNIVSNGESTEIVAFDKIFDNKMNLQDYKINDQIKQDQTKELVYTNYTLTEIYDGKYDIKVSIPVININNEKILEINNEITSTFQAKLNSIISNRYSEDAIQTIYTVEYTAYLNENILSVIIKATLKEGNNAQRLIIKAYTYNLSANEIIPLSSMLEIKGKDKTSVEKEIKNTVQDSINQAENLKALGYTIYERDINSSIYSIENSNNYFLGANGTIYIIYAYGNASYTTEKDVVIIK